MAGVLKEAAIKKENPAKDLSTFGTR